MLCLLARVSRLRAGRNRKEQAPFQPDVTNEVSERAGVLLVRLGRGSAMQVRLAADGASVLCRTVPIARAMQVEDVSEWQLAPESQLRGWIERKSAIGRWLLAKGLRYNRVAEQLTEAAALP
jgi:hypothetical protein